MARDYMGIVVNIRRDGISGISSLLETGHFADLVVKCGQKEWKLHRAILCMGSKWFEKALTGDFMEARSNEITLHEVDPELFSWVVNYIYGNEVTLGSEDVNTFALEVIRQWKSADYFVLNNLEDNIRTALCDHFHEIGHVAQWRKLQDEETDALDEDYLSSLAQAMEEAFEHSSRCSAVEDAFATLVKSSSWWVLEQEEVTSMIEKYPGLATKVFRSLMKDFRLEELIKDVPHRCAGTPCVKLGSQQLQTQAHSMPATQTYAARSPYITPSAKTIANCQSCHEKKVALDRMKKHH